MAAKSRINVQIDLRTKERALRVLSNMGLDLTSAIHIYLKHIGDTGELPFTPELIFEGQLQTAEADVKAGRTKSFRTIDDLMTDLHSDVDN
ncbi:damage-inducible protein J [Lacticaseibacillus chiayiensis]|uniref:Damage-inducible protein J n=1 Tax=Lacticaseibacillus chiayiensis TaxID=2100821 RepID=A0A4Q1TIP5_9LACO|nr:type II toxin-antitoxin system RelB/DinJ family antitoxin [Lacticaseibacillus chiayiensis]QVI35110.1 type II toxin-antitoxin system RelB/DinJ family antitoxin [Lacticaseibacillus chiayiensis]RXT18037.1 damage-inducible protein J [Lacticaseibacillus chiayiensis]UYN56894.1 type II toxin-antitoxin system RelB/DinJ family antitoxin [Lacticaseibacillus chiayiensis]